MKTLNVLKVACRLSRSFKVYKNGGKAKVTIAYVNQSNSIIHVIDAVLLPKS